MTYIYLDTNIFIHFQPYDRIKWKEIVEDDFTIVIAPIVIDELDKHKTNSNKNIAKRTKAILKKIEQDQEIGSIEIILSVPKTETYLNYGLNNVQQDHALLATILEFRESFDQDRHLLISYDTGSRLRAKQLGINACDLDEKYLLPSEESDEEKELRKLRKENAELKNNLPDVQILFAANGKLFNEFKLNHLTQTKEAYLFKSLEPLKEKFFPFTTSEEKNEDISGETHLSFERLIASNTLQNFFESINQPTQEQKVKYNNELEEYYAEYNEIIKRKYKWDKLISKSVKLDFIVSNKGTAPANDIDIFLTFPSNVKLFFFKDFPEFKKPDPPYKPKFVGDMKMPVISLNPFDHVLAHEYMRIVDEKSIEGTIRCSDINNNVVRFEYQDLKHNLCLSLEPIWAISEKNFNINYRILVANYPKKVEGLLNIIIT